MLVLTRRIGEKIQIGNDISIQVIGIGKRKVLIGLSAPWETKIQRGVYKKEPPDQSKQ